MSIILVIAFLKSLNSDRAETICNQLGDLVVATFSETANGAVKVQPVNKSYRTGPSLSDSPCLIMTKTITQDQAATFKNPKALLLAFAVDALHAL